MKLVKILLYMFIPVFCLVFSIYATVSVLLKRQETVICPDVRGAEINEAKQSLAKKGFTLNVVRYERRNEVPYNHITVQKPEANMSMRKGRVINVIVSEGPEMVKVPEVVGQTARDAEGALDSQNIGVARTLLVPQGEPGKVVAQIPGGGEEIVVGQKVTLVVGIDQRKYFVMPDLRDMDLSEVDNALEARNIKPVSYTHLTLPTIYSV
jgi:beta-lactam-binding protein with PASTA domain